MLILRAKIALNAVICMIIFYIFLDNGVMTTPKRRILSFVFTVLYFIIHQIFLLMHNCSKCITTKYFPAKTPILKTTVLQKYLKDNKHNSLHLAQKCAWIWPWTLAVPQNSQFSLSYVLGNSSFLGTDNVRE